ncbi:hypothetical protein CVT26_011409 [Gymnopilus dilepis]|uniref:Uncharacterized protein n=1 Tax=Gymnopilus dilepis TaxID=231916 RepID=A0A409X4K3_9AGAR|nr:hypothetical protein CVT26_011409 [Gymnopilus dilepis]
MLPSFALPRTTRTTLSNLPASSGSGDEPPQVYKLAALSDHYFEYAGLCDSRPGLDIEAERRRPVEATSTGPVICATVSTSTTSSSRVAIPTLTSTITGNVYGGYTSNPYAPVAPVQPTVPSIQHPAGPSTRALVSQQLAPTPAMYGHTAPTTGLRRRVYVPIAASSLDQSIDLLPVLNLHLLRKSVPPYPPPRGPAGTPTNAAVPPPPPKIMKMVNGTMRSVFHRRLDVLQLD